jgi:pimeloyl-ACP methyl ester carboxylesterase
MTASTAESTTHRLEVPGAVLAYDIRLAETENDEPVLLMVGSPMDASGFATLSGYFRDRTIVTYDPRGVSRSERIGGDAASMPEQHADDLHRLISELDSGLVDVFASSGGAVNALVLVARHPEQVRTLVAHEPPAVSALPDRDATLAAAGAIHETYMRDGFGPAMAKFIAFTSMKGPIPADFADLPAPDPAELGLPTEDDGARDDPLLGQSIVTGNHFELDFEALRAASSRIVLAAGAESEDQITYRAALAVAERLGREAVIFPSHHAGFLGGEFGQQGEPAAFAARLREVLAEAG